jgi:hypothetical protein
MLDMELRAGNRKPGRLAPQSWAVGHNADILKQIYLARGNACAYAELSAKIRIEHRRKSGFMPDFARIIAGEAPAKEISFIQQARERWRW